MLKIFLAIEKSRTFARAWTDPWVVLMAVELPSWFLRSWTRRHKSGTGLWVVAEIFEQPGLPSELNVPRGGRSPEGAYLPISSPREKRGGSPNLNYLKSAEYKNIRTFDSSPWFCISYLS